MPKKRSKRAIGDFPKTVMALQDKYNGNIPYIIPPDKLFRNGEYVGIYELKGVKKVELSIT